MTKILLTPNFNEYLQTHFPESHSYFLRTYQPKHLNDLGIELQNLSTEDEEFLADILNEFLIDNNYDTSI